MTDDPHYYGAMHSGNELACLMVGTYFQDFAEVEWQINRCLTTVLELNTLQGAVVSANLDLVRKLYVLRVLLQLVPIFGTEKEEYERAILDFMNKELPTRNVVAHSSFYATPDQKGVTFFVVKATSKFESPDIEWNLVKFKRIMDTLEAYDKTFAELHGALKKNKLEEENLKRGLGTLFGSGLPGLGLLGIGGTGSAAMEALYPEEPAKKKVAKKSLKKKTPPKRG